MIFMESSMKFQNNKISDLENLILGVYLLLDDLKDPY